MEFIENNIYVIILILMVFGAFWRFKELNKCRLLKKRAKKEYDIKHNKEVEEYKNLFEIQSNDNFMSNRFKELK